MRIRPIVADDRSSRLGLWREPAIPGGPRGTAKCRSTLANPSRDRPFFPGGTTTGQLPVHPPPKKLPWPSNLRVAGVEAKFATAKLAEAPARRTPGGFKDLPATRGDLLKSFQKKTFQWDQLGKLITQGHHLARNPEMCNCPKNFRLHHSGCPAP